MYSGHFKREHCPTHASIVVVCITVPRRTRTGNLNRQGKVMQEVWHDQASPLLLSPLCAQISRAHIFKEAPTAARITCLGPGNSIDSGMFSGSSFCKSVTAVLNASFHRHDAEQVLSFNVCAELHR